MDITTQAQKPVSKFLKVAQKLVTKVEEWASVLWVRVLGCRPRFVSKKVMNPPVPALKPIVPSIRVALTEKDGFLYSERVHAKTKNYLFGKKIPTEVMDYLKSIKNQLPTDWTLVVYVSEFESPYKGWHGVITKVVKVIDPFTNRIEKDFGEHDLSSCSLEQWESISKGR
jgi:hypothetical protein